ncbi:MAG: alpha/beta hydrolase [Pseudomonadota bacterium]
MPPLLLDPALFTENAITADTAAMTEKIEMLLASVPSVMEVGAPLVRERRKEKQGLLADEPHHEDARWGEAAAMGQTVPVRIIQPQADITGVYLHIHGGGHTLGSADAQDQSLAHFAAALGVAVVSVEYRLAPENPWPAPADDCEVAALWLTHHAKALFGTDSLFIGGESAGAHLALVTMLRLKTRHQLTPFRAANLVYGVYDMNGTPSVHTWGERNLVINTPIIQWFCDQLLPPDQFDVGRRRHPDISPLYADVKGLCPALFTIGTLDPLLDDSLLMSAKWVVAGNGAELAIYPGGIHAFTMLKDLPIAEEAKGRMIDFLQKHKSTS